MKNWNVKPFLIFGIISQLVCILLMFSGFFYVVIGYAMFDESINLLVIAYALFLLMNPFALLMIALKKQNVLIRTGLIACALLEAVTPVLVLIWTPIVGRIFSIALLYTHALAVVYLFGAYIFVYKRKSVIIPMAINIGIMAVLVLWGLRNLLVDKFGIMVTWDVRVMDIPLFHIPIIWLLFIIFYISLLASRIYSKPKVEVSVEPTEN
ncbi:MAG: hypothetical protein FWD48_09650 [Oscillospiraceae bacterium]|nr:hypothetical protein [Oscillospiraceae bacterium]